MANSLLIDRKQSHIELTLNRPEARNALSRELIAALTLAFRDAGGDQNVRSVTLSGRPPAFCAGLDLREVAKTSAEEAELDSSALLELFETIDQCPKPVIAAVNGPAVAGGAGLVSVCDIVLCSVSGRIGYPEIKRGLVAAIVMTYLRRLVGDRRAKWLLLTGELLSAEQSVQFGLANEAVADASLFERVRYYTDMFATYPPQAVANTKALMRTIRGLDHVGAVQEARKLNASMRLTAESRAGIGDFLDDKPK
jgi:methylglutaconyl-CoA hydratase